VLGLVVGLAGCGKSDGLVGTWKGRDFNGDAITMTFTKDTLSANDENGESETLSYRIKDNSLVMWKDDEENSFTFTYKINGDKLTLASGQDEDDEGSIELIRVVSKSGSGAKALVGTWEGAGGITWSFTGNKFTQEMMGVKQTVSYKIKGNSISTKYQGAEVEMEFEIDEDILTVSVMGYDLEFERVK
jgi:hypothetical protein